MPTDIAPRFEAILKQMDTGKTQASHKPTIRERALMATFWEQITPTFEEYGKLRKEVAALDLALRKYQTAQSHGFTPNKESAR